MKITRFTEAQIVTVLKKEETVIPAKEICREYSISEVPFRIEVNVRRNGGFSCSKVKRL
jgi:hypothetical protein